MDYIVRYHFDLAVVASGNFNDNNDCVSGGAVSLHARKRLQFSHGG